MHKLKNLFVLIAFIFLFLSTSVIAQELPLNKWGLPVSEDKIIKHERYWTYLDCTHKAPLFVTYQLDTADIIGDSAKNVNRDKSSWQPDINTCCPLLNEKDYKGSGYDKGHLCPAQVAKKSQKIMNETFLYSNRIPETPDLNRKLWTKIENKTISLAKKEGEKGLIVYTGAIYDSKSKTNDNIYIPSYVFEIIAGEDSNNKPHVLAWKCENKNYDKAETKDISKYLTTVDDIEQATGLNFFNKLDDQTQELIESKIDKENWQLK